MQLLGAGCCLEPSKLLLAYVLSSHIYAVSHAIISLQQPTSVGKLMPTCSPGGRQLRPLYSPLPPNVQSLICTCQQLAGLPNLLGCKSSARHNVVVQGAVHEGGVLHGLACVLAKPSHPVCHGLQH